MKASGLAFADSQLLISTTAGAELESDKSSDKSQLVAGAPKLKTFGGHLKSFVTDVTATKMSNLLKAFG